MNLFVSFTILVCLIAGEFQAGPASDPTTRLWLVGLIACLVPGLAFWQTFLISHRSFPDEVSRERSLRRLNACHTAVWLTASLAIIHAIRWHEVVRFNFGLIDFVILDELLILAPIVFSLVASWAIFYDLNAERESTDATGEPAEAIDFANRSSPILKCFSSPRIRFLTLRIQLQILILLLPVLVVFAFRDVRSLLQNQSLLWAAFILCLFFVAGYFAHLILQKTIWPTQTLPRSLSQRIETTLEESGTNRLTVRRWNTGKFVVNACVMGIVKRRMLLSDRLVDEFPEDETLAVVRHELGHLHLNHVRQRMLASLSPVFAVLSASVLIFGNPWWIENVSQPQDIPISLTLVGFGVFFIAYLAILFRQLSHATELEADLFSCCRFRCEETENGLIYSQEFCPQSALAMSKALLRLAAYHPQQFHRATWMHPSLKSRIQRLNQLPSDYDVEQALTLARRQRRRNGLLTYGLMTGMFSVIALAVQLYAS